MTYPYRILSLKIRQKCVIRQPIFSITIWFVVTCTFNYLFNIQGSTVVRYSDLILSCSRLTTLVMIYKWWHAFIRKRTKPIPQDLAILWKKRLSLFYGFIAWNAFGLVVYSMYQGKSDWAHYYGFKSDEDKNLSPGYAWANTLGIKNAKVIRISGISKVDEYDIVDGKEVRKEQEI